MKRVSNQRDFTQRRDRAATLVVSCLAVLFVFTSRNLTSHAFGQDGLIEIKIDRPEDVGLDGLVRPGTWAPMRVTVKNNTPQVMNLHLEWIMPDVDGDEAILQRTPVPLGPNRTSSRWVYAVPTIGSDLESGWVVRCIDAESGDTLASKRVAPKKVLNTRTGVIGITGGGLIGLGPYRDAVMQHENLHFLTNVIPSKLPDQWHGLSLLDMLIWTPNGGDPNDPANAAGINAIRDWVWRGGHLVVSLSSVDVAWSDPASKLADMLPPVKINQSEIPTPAWLYPADKAHRYLNTTFSARTFEPLEGPNESRNVTILQPDPKRLGPPLIAASSYGFGRVTLVGIDLTDTRFVTVAHFIRHGLPRFWKTVAGFQNPGYLHHLLPPYKQLVKDSRVASPISNDYKELSKFIPGQVAMKQTAATTLFAAVLLFGVYWLVAGPVMYGTLKARGMLRHSWLVFGGIVIVFSAVSWLGAMLLRPGQINTTHFSVVDIDTTQSKAGHIRTQSWFSIFVPKHGTSSIQIKTGRDSSGKNLLASPGLPGSDKGNFSGSQNYVVNTISPETIDNVPMRSTAKQFQAHYSDQLAGSSMEKTWEPPTGELTLAPVTIQEKGGKQKTFMLPTGKLKHNLPGALSFLTVFYCTGSPEDTEAHVWFSRSTWQPGASFSVAPKGTIDALIRPPGSVTAAERSNRGVTDPKKILIGYERRSLHLEGKLGNILKGQASTHFEAINALSFFNYLPPPDFVEDPQANTFGTAKTPMHFMRSVGRTLDLSHMVPMRRLIIIGHMQKSAPIPLPLSVDDEEVASEGWTVVRFILPVRDRVE